MKLLNTRIVQDIDLEMSFDEFISLSAKLGAIRSISRRHGIWFEMSRDDMWQKQFGLEFLDLGHDTYAFHYKGPTDIDDDDLGTVEF